jgi:hypothetical protein
MVRYQSVHPHLKWIYVNNAAPRVVMRRGGEWTLLRHWGLIESSPNEDPKKRNSGLWRPTEKGVDFAFGRLLIPSHFIGYNNMFIEYHGEHVGIKTALGEHFSYDELMRGGGYES